jgi:cytosine deaminase
MTGERWAVVLHADHRERRVQAIFMDRFLEEAIKEAEIGLAEGGIPIGSVLVIDSEIVGRGHNRRIQRGSAVLHAEMDCLENAGRLLPADYRRSTLYSTLSPCDMCSGASLLYRIPRIVIGENITFRGPEDYLRSRGTQLVIANDARCIELMKRFIASRPTLWNEDIGEE